MMTDLLILLRVKIRNAEFYPLMLGNSICFEVIFLLVETALYRKLGAYLVARDFTRRWSIDMKAKASVIPGIALIPAAL